MLPCVLMLILNGRYKHAMIAWERGEYTTTMNLLLLLNVKLIYYTRGPSDKARFARSSLRDGFTPCPTRVSPNYASGILEIFATPWRETMIKFKFACLILLRLSPILFLVLTLNLSSYKRAEFAYGGRLLLLSRESVYQHQKMTSI